MLLVAHRSLRSLWHSFVPTSVLAGSNFDPHRSGQWVRQFQQIASGRRVSAARAVDTARAMPPTVRRVSAGASGTQRDDPFAHPPPWKPPPIRGGAWRRRGGRSLETGRRVRQRCLGPVLVLHQGSRAGLDQLGRQMRGRLRVGLTLPAVACECLDPVSPASTFSTRMLRRERLLSPRRA